jgi:hypothetical protein
MEAQVEITGLHANSLAGRLVSSVDTDREAVAS